MTTVNPIPSSTTNESGILITTESRRDATTNIPELTTIDLTTVEATEYQTTDEDQSTKPMTTDGNTYFIYP